jgi:hypothetical protein
MTYYDIQRMLDGLKILRKAHDDLEDINDYALWGHRDSLAQMMKDLRAHIKFYKKRLLKDAS